MGQLTLPYEEKPANAHALVPDGFYTVVIPDGSHRTFRLRTIKKGQMKGARLIGYLRGSCNETQYAYFAFLRGDGNVAIWKRYRDNNGVKHLGRLFETVVSHPEQAGKAYAMKSGKCYRCGRLLTHPQSILSGIGPECAKK